MTSETRTMLERRGYRPMADGSLSRPDSHRATSAVPTPSAEPAKQRGARRPKTPAERSPLALKFEAVWTALGGPELEPEFRFHATRKWRLDYFHAPTMIAIELEGGIFCRGRHSRPKGMQGDAEKYNSCALVGITVFRLTTGQVTRERVEPIIQSILSRRG